jgi:4-amino-4-deoxy-L-arabinose transferase-like glycosyltransferase
VLLQIVWACFVLLLFSAIKTKLPTYILPAMAPLAILTGRAAFIAARSALKSRLGLKISAIVLFVAVLVFNVLTFKLTGWVGLFLKQQQLLLGFLLVGSLVYMGAIFAGKIRRALCILLAIGAISVAFAMPQAHLAFYQDRQMPVNALTMQVKEQGGNLATIIRFEPSFEYYLHHHVPCITSAAKLKLF